MPLWIMAILFPIIHSSADCCWWPSGTFANFTAIAQVFQDGPYVSYLKWNKIHLDICNMVELCRIAHLKSRWSGWPWSSLAIVLKLNSNAHSLILLEILISYQLAELVPRHWPAKPLRGFLPFCLLLFLSVPCWFHKYRKFETISNYLLLVVVISHHDVAPKSDCHDENTRPWKAHMLITCISGTRDWKFYLLSQML